MTLSLASTASARLSTTARMRPCACSSAGWTTSVGMRPWPSSAAATVACSARRSDHVSAKLMRAGVQRVAHDLGVGVRGDDDHGGCAGGAQAVERGGHAEAAGLAGLEQHQVRGAREPAGLGQRPRFRDRGDGVAAGEHRAQRRLGVGVAAGQEHPAGARASALKGRHVEIRSCVRADAHLPRRLVCDPVRVLVWHGFLLGGTGSNVYNARLCAAFAQQGHEISLVSQEPHAKSLQFVDAIGHPRRPGGAPRTRPRDALEARYRRPAAGLRRRPLRGRRGAHVPRDLRRRDRGVPGRATSRPCGPSASASRPTSRWRTTSSWARSCWRGRSATPCPTR